MFKDVITTISSSNNTELDFSVIRATFTLADILYGWVRYNDYISSLDSAPSPSTPTTPTSRCGPARNLYEPFPWNDPRTVILSEDAGVFR
jgi:hypothetical protein